MLAWKLKDTLDAHHITRYALQKESGVPMNTIRAMYDGETTRVDFKVIDRVIPALRRLSQAPVSLSDVLAWGEDAPQEAPQ